MFRSASAYNERHNDTMGLDTSHDVGIKGFQLISTRAYKRRDPADIVDSSMEISIRLYFSEMCARITLQKSEMKIDFNDIYAVEVE